MNQLEENLRSLDLIDTLGDDLISAIDQIFPI